MTTTPTRAADCGTEDRDDGEYCADYHAACTACCDAMSDAGEAAEQRANAAFYGGDGPQTQREQYEAAAQERWQEDRAWMRRLRDRPHR
ncbi:MAG: hypothetical protein IT379_37360 [Deltaproteobacteria bacterium]|nr:hypothetical protein [Deltaproteobacteria bacterium]